MFIIYLNSDYYNPLTGNKGASVHMREIILAWRKLHHQVLVVTTCKGRKDFPQVREIRPIRSKLLGGDFSRILTNFKILFLLLLLERRPSFIYERYEIYGFAGVFLAHILQIPHVLEVNAPLLEGPSRRVKFKRLAEITEKIILRLSSLIIITTQELKKYLEGKTSPTKIKVVPDGVDPEKFFPRSKDKELMKILNISKEDKVVGFVGSLSPRQGLFQLLEAVKDMREEIKILIVGEGRLKERIMRRIQELSLSKKVILTGEIDHEEIPRYLSLMDIAILPDISIYSSPIKLFEYMACGKPIIAPRKGQIARILTPGKEGVLINPDRTEEIRESILYLLQNPEIAREMGVKAREKVLKDYTWLKQGRKVLKWVEELKA